MAMSWGTLPPPNAMRPAKVIEACARHLPALLDADEAAYMNKVALDLRPPKPKTPKKPADTQNSSED